MRFRLSTLLWVMVLVAIVGGVVHALDRERKFQAMERDRDFWRARSDYYYIKNRYPNSFDSEGYFIQYTRRKH